MIGYFTKAGDPEVEAIFGPYRQSFRRLLKNKLEGRKYGDGLNLILIQYHLEGRFLQTTPQMFKVLSYRKKEQS
jgi:hypothetical protein